MTIRKLMIAFLLLPLIRSTSGQQEQRWVLLPASEATEIGARATWQPTKVEIDELEANLPLLSELPAKGWSPARVVLHPDKYFRQYVAVIDGGKRKVFVNAMCNVPPSPDWHVRFISTADGGSCFWHVTYDPATKKFSGLEINGQG